MRAKKHRHAQKMMLFRLIFIPYSLSKQVTKRDDRMPTPFYWNELNTYDFAGLSPETTIAVLPIASTEQHGPHLPIATDVAIATGMLAELKRQRPEDLDILVLPTQEIGKANEHIYGPGTLSLSAELLIPVWTAIGAKVAEAGLRKMVIVNSHGGNVDIMSIVARELRVRHQMAVVSTQWGRFGHPEGMVSDHEQIRHPRRRCRDVVDAALPPRAGAHGQGSKLCLEGRMDAGAVQISSASAAAFAGLDRA